MNQKEFVDQFIALLDSMKTTMLKKNNDYSKGEDPFKNLRRHGTYGIVVRLDDKLSRLDSFTNPKYAPFKPEVNESLEETAMDTAVYSLLLVLLNRLLNAPTKVISIDEEATPVAKIVTQGPEFRP